MSVSSLQTAGPDSFGHQPVMAEEVLDFLQPSPGGYYLDGTLGLGGHALRILQRCNAQCRVLGMDLDQEVLDLAESNMQDYSQQVQLVQDVFHRFDLYLQDLGWEKLDGALLDLGVSSLQLDKREKGFSFIQNGPLDMRMSMSHGFQPASSLVQKASFSELKRIIWEYGEEPMASRIAKAIVQAREKGPITTTLELADIVEQAYPAPRRRSARNHPATKTFQALRITVNQELESLQAFLKKIKEHLKPGSRLVIISFHSLEDRIVKHFFREQASTCLCPPRTPICNCGHQKEFHILTKKPLTATEKEKQENPRSRSAKLRAAEKT